MEALEFNQLMVYVLLIVLSLESFLILLVSSFIKMVIVINLILNELGLELISYNVEHLGNISCHKGNLIS